MHAMSCGCGTSLPAAGATFLNSVHMIRGTLTRGAYVAR